MSRQGYRVPHRRRQQGFFGLEPGIPAGRVRTPGRRAPAGALGLDSTLYVSRDLLPDPPSGKEKGIQRAPVGIGLTLRHPRNRPPPVRHPQGQRLVFGLVDPQRAYA